MTEVNNTLEEPKQEPSTPVKSGADAQGTTAKDADEIIEDFDKALDDISDTDKVHVRKLVKEFEKSISKKYEDKV